MDSGTSRRSYTSRRGKRPSKRKVPYTKPSETPPPPTDMRPDVPAMPPTAPRDQPTPRVVVTGKGPNLKPQALSRQPTQARNDPSLLYVPLLVEGLAGFYSLPMVREFQIDFSTFIALAHTSYDAECIVDKTFRKTISYGMYQYYLVFLLWSRLFYIRSARGDYIAVLEEMKKSVPIELAVPKDVECYLNCIGHLTDTSDCRFDLVLQADLDDMNITGAEGSYGLMTPANSNTYTCLPAPIITLLKIRADLQFMADKRANQPLVREWDLPPGLRPVAAAPLLPTANLAGWTPACALSVDQEGAIFGAGIDLNHFDVVNIGGFPVNRRIISLVSGTLEYSRSKCFTRMPVSSTGSLAQACYSVRTGFDNQVIPGKSIAIKGASTKFRSQGSSAVASAAAVFRYRVDRRPVGLGNNDGVCYRFAGVPPAAWLNHSNDTFLFGGVAHWNDPQFGGGTHDGLGLLMNFSMKMRKDVGRE